MGVMGETMGDGCADVVSPVNPVKTQDFTCGGRSTVSL